MSGVRGGLGAEDEIGADGKAEESREGLGYKEWVSFTFLKCSGSE